MFVQMLKEHLQVCREEDDDADILELGRMGDMDSDYEDEEDEEDEQDIDDPNYNVDSSPSGTRTSTSLVFSYCCAGRF